jgi:hypothetical protein
MTTREISKVLIKPRGIVELCDSNKHCKIEVMVRGLERSSKVDKDSMLPNNLSTLTYSQTGGGQCVTGILRKFVV